MSATSEPIGDVTDRTRRVERHLGQLLEEQTGGRCYLKARALAQSLDLSTMEAAAELRTLRRLEREEIVVDTWGEQRGSTTWVVTEPE